MRRFLLDSNAVNAFVDHRESVVERVREARQRGDRLGTCEPVVAELFYGLEFSSRRDENAIRLRRGLSQIKSWPFNRAAAEQYGRIAGDFRRRGRPMQVVDMMLAAIALTLPQCTVFTADSDLSAVKTVH